jgi:hypothetical protein
MTDLNTRANLFKDSISNKNSFICNITEDQYDEFLTTDFYQENKNNKKIAKRLHDLHQANSKDISLLNKYLYGSLKNYFNFNYLVRNKNLNMEQTIYLLNSINIYRFSNRDFEYLANIKEVDKNLIFNLAIKKSILLDSIIEMSLLDKEDIIKILQHQDFKFNIGDEILFNFVVNNIDENNIKNISNKEDFNWFVLRFAYHLYDKHMNSFYKVDPAIINFFNIYLRNCIDFKSRKIYNEYNYKNIDSMNLCFDKLTYLANLIFA